MSKISRNSKCPCGSGKKYKKCCLQKNKISATQDSFASSKFSMKELEKFYEEDDKFVNLSNSIVDLINENKLEDAEKACFELADQYPDQIDSFERFAMLYEARKDYKQAIEYYKKSEVFARNNEGFDPELIEYYSEKIQELGEVILKSTEQID